MVLISTCKVDYVSSNLTTSLINPRGIIKVYKVLFDNGRELTLVTGCETCKYK